MIRAYLDSNELKLFPEMAIGLTIENFNISDLSNRKIDRTNVIRVPKAGNEAIFEFSSVPNAPTDFAYNDYNFDLIVDGIFVYENGRAFIAGEDDHGYTLNITNDKNIIDLLKSISLATLYQGDDIVFTNATDYLNVFKQKTAGFKIDFLYHEDDPDADKYKFYIWFNYLSIYVDTILDKIETDYSISFSGDLLTDSDFEEMRIPCVSANLIRDWDEVNIHIQDLVIHDSLTAWDLIKNILQLFCGVFKIDGTDMELQKFNDLDITTPVNWTGKLVSKKKNFSIPDVAQKNYIKHTVASEVDKNQSAGLIECNNANIPYEKDLATMSDKLFPFRDINSFYTNASADPLLGIQLEKKDTFISQVDHSLARVKGLKDLIILVDSDEFLGQPIDAWLYYVKKDGEFGFWISASLNGNLTADADTTIVEYYDPTANYSLIETMLTDPVMYDAELLLNIVDIQGFDHFKAVQIDELEGIFYVNKIGDFLATSPGIPTKVEFIKIS